MSVTVRRKPVKKGTMEKLFLDIYQDGFRKKEILNLEVYAKPKNNLERQYNKEKERIAEAVRIKREVEIQQGMYGLKSLKNRKQDYLEYFRSLVNFRKKTGVNYETWISVLRQLEKYSKDVLGRSPRFDEINNEWMENFKQYLLGKVAQNSASNYFNKVKASLYQAERDKIIMNNPAPFVDSPKIVDTKREYLVTTP